MKSIIASLLLILINQATHSWTIENGWRYLWDESTCVAGYELNQSPVYAQFWNGKEWLDWDSFNEQVFDYDPFTYLVDSSGKFVAAWKIDHLKVGRIGDRVSEVWFKVGQKWVKP